MAINKRAKEEEVVEDVAVEQDDAGLFETEEDETVVASVSKPKAKKAQPVATQDDTPETPEAAAQGSALVSSPQSVGITEEELEDLEIGFGACPVISLNTVFSCSEDVEDIESGFSCIILNHKARYLYRTNEAVQKDVSVFYTYDNPAKSKLGDPSRVTTSGDQYDDILAEWREEGRGGSFKKYLEVTAIIQGGELDGKICILSISPASIGRYTMYITGDLAMKGLNYKQVVTKVSPGGTVKTATPFKPWNFELGQ